MNVSMLWITPRTVSSKSMTHFIDPCRCVEDKKFEANGEHVGRNGLLSLERGNGNSLGHVCMDLLMFL